MWWRDLLLALVGAVAGALFAGLVGWWADTYARNAARFAAARTLRLDLLRVAEQLRHAIAEEQGARQKKEGKGAREKVEDQAAAATEPNSWSWLVDLKVPSWTFDTRTALAQHFTEVQSWKPIEDAVRNIALVEEQKRRKLAVRVAVEPHVPVQEPSDEESDLGRTALVAKSGVLDGPLLESELTLVENALRSAEDVAESLDWSAVPAPVRKEQMRRVFTGDYFRAHAAGLALGILAAAAIAGVSLWAATRPSTRALPIRVADSLESGLSGATGRFGACEPVSTGSPRFLCELQFKGSTCKTAVLAPAASTNSGMPARRLASSGRTREKCYEQIIAEADERSSKVLAALSQPDANPETEPMSKTVEVELTGH